MSGKVVALRLNEEELSRMEEIAKEMDRRGSSANTVGKCIKLAMRVSFFEEGDIMDERITGMEKGINFQIAKSALTSIFMMYNQTFKPDFVDWLLSDQGLSAEVDPKKSAAMMMMWEEKREKAGKGDFSPHEWSLREKSGSSGV